MAIPHISANGPMPNVPKVKRIAAAKVTITVTDFKQRPSGVPAENIQTKL
jgi:hypothetical protein